MPGDFESLVAGLLLAAGSSTRMGTNKLLIRLDGESLVRRAARCCLAARLDPVLAVVGHEHDRVGEELADLPVRLVANPDFARGVQTSLRAGIAAVPDSAAAAVVVLADMPLVTGEMIGAVVRRFRDCRAPLVISEYGGVSAPPTLYARSLFAELGGNGGEGGGKRVVRRHRDEASVLAWPPDRLPDLDAPGDLERIREILAAGKIASAATS